MPRVITSHLVPASASVPGPEGSELKIEVLDDAGSGGASHFYRVSGYDATRNPSYGNPSCPPFDSSIEDWRGVEIFFQNGSVLENGLNGLTCESLLAIVHDRLECFQNGGYPCVENEDALWHVRGALEALHSRTMDRLRRGVEGLEAE